MSRYRKSPIAFACFILLVFATVGFGQGESRRTTVAITYPLDQTIDVPFRATTRLPRLAGAAEARRPGPRRPRQGLKNHHLPRGLELCGGFKTFGVPSRPSDGSGGDLR